jgi:hypothetical protein
MSFGSKLESAVHDHLLLLEKLGQISDIRLQPTIYLTEARIAMRPDFCVTDIAGGFDYHVEAKGFHTDVWKIKLKIYRVYGPTPLHIYEGTYKRLILKEVVVPKGIR